MDFSILPEFGILVGSIFSFVAFGLLWYYLFWKPYDSFTDLTDFGFEDTQRSKHLNNLAKRERINELRLKRKSGDLPPAYPNGWFVILESAELPIKGGVKEVYAFGLNLVAWRGKSGTSYVADAYCPHLGAHLGVGGQISGECITCPFHGWSFQGSDGSLVNIPYSDTILKSVKIKMWTSVEMNGFIYMWYHAEGEEPSWFPELIPEIHSGEFIYRGRSEFRTACHIQEISENGADYAHLNIVHDKAMMSGGDPEHSFFQCEFIKHVFCGEWKESSDPGQRHVAYLNITHEMRIFNKISLLKATVKVKQIGPGTVSLIFDTAFGRAIFLHTATPIEPLVQKVLHTCYSSKTFLLPFVKLIMFGEVIMYARDIRIWNRKTYVSNPILTKEDRQIKSLRRWFSQFYSKNSPRAYFSKNDVGSNSLEF